MENASKALLIAAGILIGLILITMIIYGHGQISSYYKTRDENKKIEQLAEFNKQYIGYNRDDVRGSDLLSLINKTIDHNTLSEGMEEDISIIISPLRNDGKEFYYKYDENRRVKLIDIRATYSQSNIQTQLLDEVALIEDEYTPELATKLATNISTVMGDNTRKTKKDLLVELKMMNPEDDDSKADDIVENADILKYYQYIQFKRAHFNCEELTYKDRKSTKVQI